jgi:hypothetical protein
MECSKRRASWLSHRIGHLQAGEVSKDLAVLKD